MALQFTDLDRITAELPQWIPSDPSAPWNTNGLVDYTYNTNGRVETLDYIKEYKIMLDSMNPINPTYIDPEDPEKDQKDLDEYKKLIGVLETDYNIDSIMSSIKNIETKIEKNLETQKIYDTFEKTIMDETCIGQEDREKYTELYKKNINLYTTKNNELNTEKKDLENKLKKALHVLSLLRINKRLEYLCGICQDHPITKTLECGHVYCDKCVEALKLTCAYCKQRSTKMIKLYF